jgi:coenzyme PQQ biosynthesis protein PqqD
MPLTPASRPRLASKARLRWDKREGKYFLLYPERGLLLNATAADVVQLCTGEHTVDGIVSRLAGKYAAQTRSELEREVMAFLDQIATRGLLEVEGSWNTDRTP